MMREMPFAELTTLAEDCSNGWSIGSFGSIGEFVRDADETACFLQGTDRIEAFTSRGAIRLTSAPLKAIAWDGLSSDGRSWTHNVAFCVPSITASRGTIIPLGQDTRAIQRLHRSGSIFDLGVARGLVRMCVRTEDPALKSALDGAAGSDFLSQPDLREMIMRVQPHRVLLSPAGRIEVYQRIPGYHEASPVGPHTHLIERLIASGKLHNANDPIPAGWQAVLNLHPPRPWFGDRAARTLDHDCDVRFLTLLERYGASAEAALEQRLVAAIVAGIEPWAFTWPDTRRARTKARLILRRLSAAGCERADAWRVMYDPSSDRQQRRMLDADCT